ncbi:hypothetical protein [Halobacterium zhouii]|uniref:hypothetical protein n=1 Tax=Halobacterium zhouii TaxID=2902624 RepID=UPI001E28BD5A|nr:hypothetical protein [Halobacterium zhouii]
MVVPLSTSAASGHALQVLFVFPVVVGVALLADPERVLVLHRFLGFSAVSDGEVDVRLWRLRGAAFVAVGVFVLWAGYHGVA